MSVSSVGYVFLETSSLQKRGSFVVCSVMMKNSQSLHEAQEWKSTVM